MKNVVLKTSNKIKTIKIRLADWKVLHSVKTNTEQSIGNIINSILKNTKKEDIIQWTRKNLKN